MKKYFYLPNEAWSIHENNHEPIIAKCDFEIVQELMTKDTKVSHGSGQLHLFSGIIHCAGCGQTMTIKRTKKNGNSYAYYVCSTNKRRRGECSSNSISSNKVEKFVLSSIKNQVDSLLLADEVSTGLGLANLKSRKKASLENMIANEMQSIEDNNSFIAKSYTHMLERIITKEEYNYFSNDYKAEIAKSEKQIDHLRSEIKRFEDDTAIRELIERFKSYGNINTLDRRMVVSFVTSITVHSNQTLDINMRYDGDFALTETDETPESVQSNPRRAVV